MAARFDHPIVGVWRLFAHETILDDGEVIRQFGDTPRGRLILTASGYMSGFAAAPDRKGGLTDDRRSDLHRSMIAYGGTYRIVGNEFIVAVDLSWHAMWDGTEQTRTFRIEGNRLDIVSSVGPSPFREGRTSYGRLAWVREA